MPGDPGPGRLDQRPDGPLDQLSIYVLPGRTNQPAVGLLEARDAERAGFGSVYVSERLDMKDAAVVCGAIVGVAPSLRVGTALVHQGTRHPLSLATMGATLQSLTGGRFVLGLGRGLGALAPSMGVPKATLASLEHLVSVMRRLWSGERISEDGPAGSFHRLRFTDVPTLPPPPVLLGTVGPKGLALAGRAFDGAILHPFLTNEAVAASVGVVRQAAMAAGHDPASAHIVATLVAAPDLTEERVGIAVRARAVSYFQVRGLGEQLVSWNGWDPAVLNRLREHPTLAGKGIADTALTRDRLVDSSTALPDEWYATAATVGTARECSDRVRELLAAGADEVLIHGASPAEASGLAAAFRAG